MARPAPAADKRVAEVKPRTSDARVLTGPEKVAALLLAMSKPIASRILAQFEPDEIKLLAQTATDLGSVSKEQVEDLIEEFGRSLKIGQGLNGSVDQVEGLLATILPPDKLQEVMTSLRERGSGPVWSRLADLPMPMVTQHFIKEHPQTTAFLLSKAPATFAAALLKQFPMDLQKQIARRILALRPVHDKPLRMLEETLQTELLVNAGRNSVVSIHSRLADIINKMDRKDAETVLHVLDEHRPDDTELIRQLLFTFEDIARLTTESLTTLLDNVPPDRITLILHGAPQELKELILGSVPGRSKRMIEQDLETGPVPRTKDVNKARRALADMALEMIERGVIEMRSRDDDEDYD